jgi:hypothetical protein
MHSKVPFEERILDWTKELESGSAGALLMEHLFPNPDQYDGVPSALSTAFHVT